MCLPFSILSISPGYAVSEVADTGEGNPPSLEKEGVVVGWRGVGGGSAFC
jgi:hypothetical protein